MYLETTRRARGNRLGCKEARPQAGQHFGVTVLRQNFIGNNLTVESFVYGLVIGLRFATLCMWLEAIFRVVTSDKVVYIFGRVSPRLSLFLTILLRFIPRVGREARKINLAQKGIGGTFLSQ